MPLATARSSGADAARTERTGGSPDGLRGRQGVAARQGARWGLRRSVRFRTPSLRAEVARDHPALLSYRLDASHAGLGKPAETQRTTRPRATYAGSLGASGSSTIDITVRAAPSLSIGVEFLTSWRFAGPGSLRAASTSQALLNPTVAGSSDVRTSNVGIPSDADAIVARVTRATLAISFARVITVIVGSPSSGSSSWSSALLTLHSSSADGFASRSSASQFEVDCVQRPTGSERITG